MKYLKEKLSAAILLLSFFSCSSTNFDKLKSTRNKYNLSTEKLLLNSNYTSKIDSFYNSGTKGTFSGVNNIKIYYKTFIQPQKEKGAILISTGRTEAAIKYKEVIFDLFNNGYSIYIHDHRGQGFSGRMTNNHEIGYIDEFQYYIDDMKKFYDTIVIKGEHKNIFLLSHSMGGAISATYLEQNSNDFKAAVLISPMLGLPFPICPIIKTIYPIITVLAGEKPKYAIGNKNYEESISNFDKNDLTNCEIRYNRTLEAFNNNPKTQIGGASYRWIYKSCKQFKIIFDNVNKIKTPILLFSGGKDKVISTSAHRKFIKKLKKYNSNNDIEAYFLEKSQHEALFEIDKIRIKTINKTLNFFEKYTD